MMYLVKSKIIALIKGIVGLPSPFFKGLSIGTIPDYTDFEDTGFMMAYGEAKAWDDLRFPATSSRLGILDKPDFDFVNIGLLFPQNDSSEFIEVIGQMPHDYAEGTDIDMHIHWDQDINTDVNWVVEYKWYNNNEIIPGVFITESSNVAKYAYASGNLSQITDIIDIDGTGMLISSIFKCKIYRDDNDTIGDVLFTEFDVHYQKNSIGSREEYVK